MIKFLKGEVEQVELVEDLGGGLTATIQFGIVVITSAIQMRLLDMQKYMFSEEAKQRFVSCQFKSCIEDNKIIINGEEVDAAKFADMADYLHKETNTIITAISRKIDKHCLPNAEEEKK